VFAAETIQDGGLRLRLVGEIDMTFTVENQAALEEIVTNPPRRLELDAADLTFIDSTGLRAFATLATCVRSNGGQVQTISSSEAFGRIVAVTGLGERFGLIPAVAPAVDSDVRDN